LISVNITGTPLIVQDCVDWAMSGDCGGVNIFIGTVRSKTNGKAVVRLEFECYEKMAMKELEKIAFHIEEKYSAQKVLIHHRIGILNVSDIAVVIVVSTPHRDAAFQACRFAIDTLKMTVPIWKKEIFEDGEVWVSAHP
jgi:molybdopterin synthase catalytic subunit